MTNLQQTPEENIGPELPPFVEISSNKKADMSWGNIITLGVITLLLILLGIGITIYNIATGWDEAMMYSSNHPTAIKPNSPTTTPNFQAQWCSQAKINNYAQKEIFIYKCRNPYSEALTIDGKSQKTYYAIDKVITSPDGKNVAYFADEKVGQSTIKSFLVMNDKEYEIVSPAPQSIDADGSIQTDLITGNTIFSPDGQHFAYNTYFSDGGDVYLDGRLFKSYRHKKIDQNGGHCNYYNPVSELRFAPTNKLFHRLSKTSDSTYSTCETTLVIDGAEYDTYPNIGKFVMSPDGSKIVYFGYGEGKPIKGTDFSEGNFYLIINKEKFKTFSFPNEKVYDLKFSDNGKAICYVLGSPQESPELHSAYVIVNNKEHEFLHDKWSPKDFAGFCNSQSNILK